MASSIEHNTVHLYSNEFQSLWALLVVVVVGASAPSNPVDWPQQRDLLQPTTQCATMCLIDEWASPVRPPSVHTAYLEDFVSDLESAVLEGTALGMHTADEDTHLGTIAVAGQTDAQASEAFVQVDQQR